MGVVAGVAVAAAAGVGFAAREGLAAAVGLAAGAGLAAAVGLAAGAGLAADAGLAAGAGDWDWAVGCPFGAGDGLPGAGAPGFGPAGAPPVMFLGGIFSISGQVHWSLRSLNSARISLTISAVIGGALFPQSDRT